MCVYKTVKVHYPVRGLQDTVEKIALKKGMQDIVHRFHR
jgi:hypothetical protein